MHPSWINVYIPKLLKCRGSLSLSESFNIPLTNCLVTVTFSSHPYHSLQLFFNLSFNLPSSSRSAYLRVIQSLTLRYPGPGLMICPLWSRFHETCGTMRAGAQLLNEGSKMFGRCNLRPGPVLFILLKSRRWLWHRVRTLVTLSALVEPKLGLQNRGNTTARLIIDFSLCCKFFFRQATTKIACIYFVHIKW